MVRIPSNILLRSKLDLFSKILCSCEFGMTDRICRCKYSSCIRNWASVDRSMMYQGATQIEIVPRAREGDLPLIPVRPMMRRRQSTEAIAGRRRSSFSRHRCTWVGSDQGRYVRVQHVCSSPRGESPDSIRIPHLSLSPSFA